MKMNGTKTLNAYEKCVARACGISACDLVFHGNNETGAVYSLVNAWFYIAGTYNGYTRAEIYRDLLRRFIARAEKACGY